ncbi:DUF4922 domain-containing protein [Bacteroidales bacterium OttesenSCG-928-A17]|nr:DUF4922 domain-containing protein [Bacteroidales bacterium OttesenSCG-928-A17]
MKSVQELIRTELFERQLPQWALARDNFALLKSVRTKTVGFDDFTVKVQFNPERIRSAVAKVKPATTEKTSCFLCPEARAQEQMALGYPPSYSILLNPYPIFSRHLTIPDRQHLPQLIQGRMTDFLILARDLPDFSLLYNGPFCGASIPGHMHFQAIEKNVLPLEEDSLRKKRLIFSDELGALYHFPDYLRKVFLLESENPDWINEKFARIKQLLPLYESQEKEPRFNLLVQYNHPIWQLYIFPRKAHRPTQFFEEGDNQILISPGIVDMTGVLITVRECDFLRLNRELVEDIFRQTSISEEEEQRIVRELKVELKIALRQN